MKTKNVKKAEGFTLIELLVVVAIIAVLSTVVVSNLGSARNKGLDAAVKSQLNQLRTISEDYYQTNNNKYSTNSTVSSTCPTTASNPATNFMQTASAVSALNQIATNGSTPMYCGIDATGQSWAVTVKLKGSGAQYCVDSTGNIKNLTATPTASMVICP